MVLPATLFQKHLTGKHMRLEAAKQGKVPLETAFLGENPSTTEYDEIKSTTLVATTQELRLFIISSARWFCTKN